MAPPTSLPPEFDRGVVTTVHQGDCLVSNDASVTFSTVLGSCVSACIRDVRAGVGGMNHFLLAEQSGSAKDRYGASARYGAYAMERLGEMNSIRIFGKAREKGAIVAFEMKGAHAHDVATVIDRAGVAVRAGTHCAMPLLARYGVTSTCRASFGLYNTLEEVDKLVDALRKAESLFA